MYLLLNLLIVGCSFQDQYGSPKKEETRKNSERKITLVCEFVKFIFLVKIILHILHFLINCAVCLGFD